MLQSENFGTIAESISTLSAFVFLFLLALAPAYLYVLKNRYLRSLTATQTTKTLALSIDENLDNKEATSPYTELFKVYHQK